MSDIGTPIVSVITLVYNHAPFLEDYFQGILAQKTTFPFEVIINDDASTDASAEIIHKYEMLYPHIFKPIYHSENQYSKGVGFWNIMKPMFDKAQGKYIAFCEGDDYWIDSNKLQKQFDFISSNVEYSLVFTACKYLFPAGDIRNSHYFYSDCDISIYDFLTYDAGMIPTGSMFFEANMLIDYPKECQDCYVGDYPLEMFLTLKGKVRYLNIDTLVYRVGAIGSHTERMAKIAPEIRISGWGTNMKMYQSLDKYSSYTYSKLFRQFASQTIYNAINAYPKYYNYILENLSKNYPNFKEDLSQLQRLVLFCISKESFGISMFINRLIWGYKKILTSIYSHLK